MSSPRVHDPLFHFETHFPERLSRLHLNPEMCPPTQNRRSKRSRARHGIRYKTQPVTFDEITEVDEEGTSATEENNNKDGIKNQFAAFSRSMDGLVPRTRDASKSTTSSLGQSLTRSTSGGITQSSSHVLESRLQEEHEVDKENKENEPEVNSSSPPSSNSASGITGLPPSGLAETRDPRRQRMTAKSKRRQMMAEAVDKES